MQDSLDKAFLKLKKLLIKYEDPFQSKVNSNEEYDLWSFKDIEILGRKKNEINFVTIKKQGSFVGFYFMPIYIQPDIGKAIGSDLLKLLKGKSCFHIKSVNKDLEKQIANALGIGFQYYQDQDFV